MKKKILREDQDDDAPFLDPKWSIWPIQEFFWKKSLILSSTYCPLSWCKNFLKILQLIQSYEDAPFFLNPKWSICRNKNLFRKATNKSSKTLFLGHFDHFWSILSDEDFFQKIQLCHMQLHMGPEKFQKKLMSQFRENLRTDGRTDGQKDRRTLFHRSLPETYGGPKDKCQCIVSLRNS